MMTPFEWVVGDSSKDHTVTALTSVATSPATGGYTTMRDSTELFHEDAVMDWPQSGERVVGGENRRGVYRAFPQLPTITPRRIVSAGDLVVAEATLDYGGPVYKTVFVFEFRGDRIARETAYWSEPFDPPDWRSRWVEVA